MGEKNRDKFGDTRFTRYLDIIVSSSELKKLIKFRAEALNVSLYHVANAAGIRYATFKAYYLQEDDPKCSPALRQEHLIKVAEQLGIKIRVTLVLEDLEKVDITKLKGKPFVNESSKRRKD